MLHCKITVKNKADYFADFTYRRLFLERIPHDKRGFTVYILNAILITCVTTLIPHHLFLTLWHRLNEQFAVFFNFSASIPNLNYDLMSLAFAVESTFCKQDFKIDLKFPIGLKSGEFPGQSKIFIAALLKISFTYLDIWHGTRFC